MRRKRSVTESLGSVVLGFQVIVVFLATLVIFGLEALPPLPALGGGALLLLLMVAAVGTLRYPVGVWLGWASQIIFLASGFLVTALFFVSAIFVAIWIYCMVVGQRMDRRDSINQLNQGEPTT